MARNSINAQPTPSEGETTPAIQSHRATPALDIADEVSHLESKRRGLCVFQCPDAYSMPTIESMPDTFVLVDPDAEQDIPGEPDRIVVRLSSHYTPDLNSLVNHIVLPAYRRCIPLYLFASMDQQELRAGSVEMPAREGIEESICPLLKEQIGSLLSFVSVVFAHPEALATTGRPWLTPVETMMHDELTREGLSHELHARVGSGFADLLVRAGNGVSVAVEIDGREFVREDRLRWDRNLIKAYGIRKVIRFSGSEIVNDLGGCIERIRSNLDSLASLRCVTDPSGRRNEPRRRMPEPKPGLAGEQASCLSPRAGVVLTLAPAGSGKTRVLTRRVVEAVRGGINPGRILCVVFNKAASEVMSERIHGDAGIPDVHIRTLHSLGYEICRQAPDSPYAGYGVVTDRSLPGGLTELYRRVLRDDFAKHAPVTPHPFPEHLVIAYEEAISRYRRTLIPIDTEKAREEAEGYDGRQALRIRFEVERRMNELALMTFDEQLFRAVEILLADPRARSTYQYRFDSVLVDEVQDLTPVQFLMLRLLALPLNNLFAVGDDDQMINTFTGADPENIRSFQRWYPGAVVHTLGANYRCRPQIVNQSANVISHNLNRFEKPIRPVQEQQDSARKTIRIFKCPSMETEMGLVVRSIRRWKKLGYAYGDMAVLVRVQSIAAPLQSALKAADLPFNPIDEGALFQSHAGRTVGSYLDVIANGKKADPLSYAISLSFPSRKLSNEQLREVAAVGAGYFERAVEWSGEIQTELEDYHRCIETLGGIYRAGDRSPAGFLDELMEQSGLGEFYRKRDETSREQTALADTESIDGIRKMAERCTDTGSFADLYLRSVASAADVDREVQDKSGVSQSYADDAVPGEASTEDGARNEDRVTVTTIHRSKGDEFKGVILYHVAEGILPHRRMLGSVEDIEEERRVFYVALTRAEERLCITTQRKRPSRFLAEMKVVRGVTKPRVIAGHFKRTLDRLAYLTGRIRRMSP